MFIFFSISWNLFLQSFLSWNIKHSLLLRLRNITAVTRIESGSMNNFDSQMSYSTCHLRKSHEFQRETLFLISAESLLLVHLNMKHYCMCSYYIYRDTLNCFIFLLLSFLKGVYVPFSMHNHCTPWVTYACVYFYIYFTYLNFVFIETSANTRR